VALILALSAALIVIGRQLEAGNAHG